MRPRDAVLLAFCLLMVAVGVGAVVGGVVAMARTGNPTPLPSVTPYPGESYGR